MTRQIVPKKRPSKITIPDRCNPLAKIVFAEMKRQRVSYDQLEWDSGVLRSTFKAWRKDNLPGLATIEAALGALGWVLVPVPRMRNIPKEVRTGLEALAEQWGEIDPLLVGLMSAVCKPPPAPTPDRKAPNPIPPRVFRKVLAKVKLAA